MAMICPCGKTIENTGTSYQFCRYNDKGEIVYAICIHGYTVIDKELFDALDKEDEEKLDIPKLRKDYIYKI